MPRRSIAARTFEATCSKANSGVCTPTITRPSLWYAAYHEPGGRPQRRTLRAKARRDPAAAERDQEHRDRGPHRIRNRQQQRAPADMVARSDNRDRGEDGARARHEDESQRDAEQEAAA